MLKAHIQPKTESFGLHSNWIETAVCFLESRFKERSFIPHLLCTKHFLHNIQSPNQHENSEDNKKLLKLSREILFKELQLVLTMEVS